jgi:tetraacyldisaccharide 4'-kinase
VLELRSPAFWQADGGWMLPALLSPLSAIISGVTARRVARAGWRAPVPVVCCGNVTVGGTGKTTLVLDILRRLARRGVAAHALLRGYGARVRAPMLVTPDADWTSVGDEALLLAAVAPTWVSPDRAAGARAAVAAGARAIVMDDGLQNPGLVRDLSLLVIDGAAGFGNGRVLPAGPLREPVAAGAARCQAAVLIGPDRYGAEKALPASLPVLQVELVPGPEIAHLAGRRAVAFAGIGRPAKFFDMLGEAGVDLVATHAFPDHYAFSDARLRGLADEADRLGALAVTTPKDAVRIPAAIRERFRGIGVSLDWTDETAIDSLLASAVGLIRPVPTSDS